MSPDQEGSSGMVSVASGIISGIKKPPEGGLESSFGGDGVHLIRVLNT